MSSFKSGSTVHYMPVLIYYDCGQHKYTNQEEKYDYDYILKQNVGYPKYCAASSTTEEMAYTFNDADV